MMPEIHYLREIIKLDEISNIVMPNVFLAF